MENKQASPALIAVGVIVLVALLAGLGWAFLKGPPTNESKPPSFIDPATGRPKTAGGSSGQMPSPIGGNRGGGYPGGGYPGGGYPGTANPPGPR